MSTTAAEITWLEKSTAMCERLGSRIQPRFCKRYRKDNINCHKCPQIEEMDRLAAELPPAEPVTVPIPKREDESMSKKKIQPCADCNRTMRIVARDLCGKCYFRHKKAGTLDEKFPAKGTPQKNETKEEATASVDDAQCHKDEKGTSPDPDVTAGETAQHHDRVDQVVEVHRRPPSSFEKLVEDFDGVDYDKAEPRPIPAETCFTTLDGVDVVRIEFLERDQDLLAYLENWADEERRSLPDQILFVLDNIVFERNQELAHLVVPEEREHSDDAAA